MVAAAFFRVTLPALWSIEKELTVLESISAGFMNIIVATVATTNIDFVCRKNPQDPVVFAFLGLVPRGDRSLGDAAPGERGPTVLPVLRGLDEAMLRVLAFYLNWLHLRRRNGK